ncbi:hypothetical protein QCE47_14670 [Caballeronia sp. LZ025]|uniref:hypothetical protein n=1 Tax=Caballeronia TaxID=1827195 RepID=UPI001FD11073|nr:MULTISPECIES: hypothetical protein [Caballeronia]MDR5733574.1 hypothetical protein [Caballeronia sp. LZ025]
MPTQLNPALIEKALSITGHFEDSDDPFGAVSGNFDGMGISLGVLQWNIGSGSLQPLLKALSTDEIRTPCPTCGADLIRARGVSPSEGLKIVNQWQPGGKLPATIRNELKTLAHSEPFKAQQVKAAQAVAARAYKTCGEWCAAWNQEVDAHAFCWFFDVYTQNGGMNTVTPQQVDAFVRDNPHHGIDMICSWLDDRVSPEHGFRDANKNAQMWRNAVPQAATHLFSASFLRSQRSKIDWRADTLNRKGTIAVGQGWVHGEKQRLDL